MSYEEKYIRYDMIYDKKVSAHGLYSNVPNFSPSGELRFLRLNFPKKVLRVGGVSGQTQPDNNLF